jgi:hypothetical protein
MNLSLRLGKAYLMLVGYDYSLFYLVRPFLLFVLRAGTAELL